MKTPHSFWNEVLLSQPPICFYISIVPLLLEGLNGESHMGTLGWILFVLASFWYLRSVRFSHSKRLHLRSYIIYLLLSDEIRNKHKQDFEQWIRQVDAKEASQLGHGAQNVIENMSERLARGNPSNAGTSSTLGAHAMLWNFKRGGKVD